MCELLIRYAKPILGAISLLILIGTLTWIYSVVKETIESRIELERLIRKWEIFGVESEKKNEGSKKQ